MTVPMLSADVLATRLADARNRWRLRHAMVGVAVGLATLVVVVWGASALMEAMRFTATSITWSRALLGAIMAAAVARGVLYPLLRPLPDARLALYLEERVPALEGAVLSAVEVQRQGADATTRSPFLERGLLADAAQRLAQQPAVSTLERPATTRAIWATVAVAAIGSAMLLAGPDYLRQGARLLLTPWRDPLLASVYAIEITRTEQVVARGSDVQISARLRGFGSELVELLVRRGTSADWERIPMGAGADSTAFIARLFDVAEDAEFVVEANGVRSAIGRLTVRNLPAVSRIRVEIRSPAYMGLPPDVTEDGGDISAPRGARAVLRVRSTRRVAGGRLLFEGGSALPLALVDDSTLAATIVIQRDGFYRVELTSEDGTAVAGTVEYVIDALDDAPPRVVIRKPGRDIRPTAVEEVFIEAEATDDYGIGLLELFYRVNGGPEQRVVLAEGTGVRPRELIAGHTLFLEEMSLQPGDIMSYYASATDNDASGGAKRRSSDIQFLTVRPFGRDYRQNQQGGNPGAGGADGVTTGSLVQRQRDIVAATFKTQRDQGTTASNTYRTDVSTLHLAQGRLRNDLAELMQRVQRPAVQAADSSFRILSEVLPKASEAMRAAEELLVQAKVNEALAPEQKALQWLERAEAVFRDVQVSMNQQGGGGGGGGDAAKAEDLADLLELENDKLRNQYEQVERSQQAQSTRALDETMERLKRLAARQQQELERQQQRAQQGNARNRGGSGGGGSQRQLAQETEEMARQLERLARERPSPELERTAGELQKAADAMRRAAADGGAGGAGAGQRAADRLAEAQKLVDAGRESRTTGGLADAQQRAAALAEEQREVARDVAQLPPAGAERVERQRRLDERKQGMVERVGALAQDLDRLARETRRTQPEAARRAQDAANAIREGRMDDKIRYSRQVMRGGSPQYAATFEQSIQTDLDTLQRRVAQAAGASRTGREQSQRRTQALDQARDLVRGLSSLDERLREGGNGSAGDPMEGAGGSGGATSGTPQPGRQGPPPGASRASTDPRQLTRALRNQRTAAEALRRSLADAGAGTAELERLVARLRALEGAQVMGNAAEFEKLRRGVVNDFREFEFALRRQLGPAEADGPVLGGTDNVPPAYRDMVNEYFKSLSKPRQPE